MEGARVARAGDGLIAFRKASERWPRGRSVEGNKLVGLFEGLEVGREWGTLGG